MRQNRASRSNANFLKIIMVLGVLLLVCVGVVWYLAFRNSHGKHESHQYDITFYNTAWGDTMKVAVNGNVVFDGVVLSGSQSDTYADGVEHGNIITVSDARHPLDVTVGLPDQGGQASIGIDSAGIYVDVFDNGGHRVE